MHHCIRQLFQTTAVERTQVENRQYRRQNTKPEQNVELSHVGRTSTEVWQTMPRVTARWITFSYFPIIFYVENLRQRRHYHEIFFSSSRTYVSKRTYYMSLENCCFQDSLYKVNVKTSPLLYGLDDKRFCPNFHITLPYCAHVEELKLISTVQKYILIKTNTGQGFHFV